MHTSRLFPACFAGILLLCLAACGGSVGQVETGFTIGGTVADLRGTGLVLRNNGGDDLAITGSGAFTFPAPVVDGRPYSVTVAVQPANPEQVCVVNNGAGTVGGRSVTNVAIVCSGDFLETFDGGPLEPARWADTGEFVRQITGGALQMRLAASNRNESTTVDLVRIDAATGQEISPNAIGTLAADLTLTNLAETGDASARAELAGRFFNSPPAGALPDPADADDQTGDVRAEVGLQGGEAFYRVVHCLNDSCSRINTLTPGEGFVPLGTVGINTAARLQMDWNTLSPNRFTFQLNAGPAVTFDPVAAGAPVVRPTPNSPRKWIGLITANVDREERADLTALYDNVSANGTVHDDFENAAFLRGTLWNRASGRIEVGNGTLTMEAGKQFTGNAAVDGGLDTTEIETRTGLFVTAAVVEGEITIDPVAAVTQLGGAETEARAVLEMDFQPPEAAGLENLFEVQAVLRRRASGSSARLIAVGCGDRTCSPASQFNIPGQVQDFATPVGEGRPHHFRIEHAGGGIFRVTLDRVETLSVDLSQVPQFAGAVFDRVRLRCRVRDTDAQGEQAFIRAFFDNVRVGAP